MLLVMDYMEGGPVLTREGLERGRRIPEPLSLQYFRDMCKVRYAQPLHLSYPFASAITASISIYSPLLLAQIPTWTLDACNFVRSPKRVVITLTYECPHPS